MSPQIEITVQRSQSRQIAWADGRPSLQSFAVEEGLCVRVQENGQQGILTTRSVHAPLGPLTDAALRIARQTPADPASKLGSLTEKLPAAIKSDDTLFSQPLEGLRDRLAQLEKTILSVDSRIKKVVKLQISESRSDRALSHPDGPSLKDTSSGVGFAVEVLAEDPSGSEVGWDYQGVRFWEDLNIDAAAVSAAHHSAESLGAKPLPSGKYPVVMSPRVGVQLLQLVTNALSAEAVQRGRSFFAGQRGRSVAASVVTLIDDPLLPRGVASAAFDDEGMPHQRLEILADGILKEYFYDLRSAFKDKTVSNGHGLKASLGALPRPAPTNFFMKAGSSSVMDLLGSDPHVFLVNDVMGLHMADPITGEFSLGASGRLYEKGKPVRSVRGVTIAGSVASIFKSVSAVANDFRWMGSFGSPSFLLSSVTVAGT